jgi:hypothetical protein
LNFQDFIKQNDWTAAAELVQAYFLPNNIDLFPVFQSIKKILPKTFLPNFESLVSLVPIESPIIQTLNNCH